MNVPKTPKEFDYDLWTTESGAYMVRVKSTGEICEVDAETMRFLRSEEKRLRRFLNMSAQAQSISGVVLSLDHFRQEIEDNPISARAERKSRTIPFLPAQKVKMIWRRSLWQISSWSGSRPP